MEGGKVKEYVTDGKEGNGKGAKEEEKKKEEVRLKRKRKYIRSSSFAENTWKEIKLVNEGKKNTEVKDSK